LFIGSEALIVFTNCEQLNGSKSFYILAYYLYRAYTLQKNDPSYGIKTTSWGFVSNCLENQEFKYDA